MKTTHVPVVAKDENDEEAAMDIPPPSLTAAPSLIAGANSLVAPFDYVSAFQNLFERLDTISLNVQQMCLDYQEDMCTLTNNFQVYREE